MRYINRLMVAVLIVAGLPVSASSDTARKGGPARVELIPGTDAKRVVLTAKAAERLGIETALVRDAQVSRTRVVVADVVALPAAGTGLSKGDTGLRQFPPGKILVLGQAPSEVTHGSQIGVRVPLSSRMLKKVAKGKPARVLTLTRGSDDDDDGPSLPVLPVEVPAGETALYYGVDSPEHSLVPGQRVRVRISLAGKRKKRKVVPYSAVLYDVHGDTWVYTNPEPLAFVRHEVDVDYIEGDVAVLDEGPPIGSKVVTVGATLLWSVETGFGKAK